MNDLPLATAGEVIHKATETLGPIKSMCGNRLSYNLSDDWKYVTCKVCLKHTIYNELVPETSCYVRSIITEAGRTIRMVANTTGNKEKSLLVEQAQYNHYIKLVLTEADRIKLIHLLEET